MPSRRTTLVLVLVATFMLLLDISVVTVALPQIRADLSTSFASSQWVLDAYALALATLLLPAASFSDRRGRKPAYMVGLALFTAASLGCALSPSVLVLSLARTLQGIGGAIVFATALPLIGAAYPDPRERTGAVAAFGATVAIAVAIGPLVGGALTQAFGWSAIFLINLPVGVAALIAASRRLIDARETGARQPLDLQGMGLLGAGLFTLVFATVRGNVEGWGSPIIVGGYVLATLLLGAFVRSQYGRADAMVDLTLFRSRAFSAAGISVLALGGLIGALVPLVTFLQNGLGNSALQAGAELLPISGMSFVAAAVTARVLSERVGAGTLLGAGLSLVAAGLGLMMLVRSHPSFGSLLPGMMLSGLGWGTINVTATELALATVAPERAGMATGTLNVLRQVGLAAGIAALGAVFQGGVATGMPGAAADAFLVGAVITGAGAVVAVAIHGVTHGRLSATVAAHVAEHVDPADPAPVLGHQVPVA